MAAQHSGKYGVFLKFAATLRSDGASLKANLAVLCCNKSTRLNPVTAIVLMFRSILNALLGVSSSRQQPQQNLDRRNYDDADDIVSFEIGGRRRSTCEKDWWAFSFPPNRPEGEPWRIALDSVEVAGTQHRRDAVSGFVHEVQATQNQGKLKQFPFSVCLEAEPNNRYDPFRR